MEVWADFWRSVGPPWSLRRNAALAKWRGAEVGATTRFADVGGWIWKRANTAIWPFVLITAATFVPLLPFVHVRWGIHRLRDEGFAIGFLQTLWQVDAAAIALSLAIILFVFESVRGGRGTSLRRFARDIGLVYVLALGFAALFNIAGVLLGLGSGAPAGWAATWSTFCSIAALASLPYLLQRALRAMDPETLRARQLQEIREDAIAATEAEILRRVALQRLQQQAESHGIRVNPLWVGERPAGARFVSANKQGVVYDIRLRRLRQLGKAGNEPGMVPALLVQPGAYVTRESYVAVIRDDATRRQRRAARRIVRIRRTQAPERQPLRDVVERLHEAALEAIRDGLPSTYDNIADEYLEMLTTLPEVWKRYGVDFTPGAASGDVFELMPLDWISGNLWEEMREAARGTSREVAITAFHLPFRVAYRAVDMNATGLYNKMLTLYVQIYPKARGASDPDVRRLVHHRCIDHPLSLAKLAIAYPLQDADLPEAKRAQLEGFLRLTFRAIAELAKAAMDEDPNDDATIAQINGGWDEVLQHWNPEHDRPYEWEVEHAEQQLGVNHPDTVALRESAARRDRMVATKEEASRWKSALRFGLAYWAFHRLISTQDDEWLTPLDAFRGYLGGIEQLTAAADGAIRYEERQPWFFWRLDETYGSTVGPNVEGEMVRAYLAFAVLVVDPARPVPPIGAAHFLERALPDVENALNAVRGDVRIWRLVPPPPDIDRRWARLRRALRAAAAP